MSVLSYFVAFMKLMTSAPRSGRRDRNMSDKQARIFQAAAGLFDERGYSCVTTQAISERADVAAGTLFRYAASKDELLLMVLNQALHAGLTEGAKRARALRDPVDVVVEMVTPILHLGHRHAENLAVYQRQLMFGPPGEKYRSEGLALLARLEAAVAARLLEQAAARGLPARPELARVASISVFGAAHLAVSRASTGAHPDHAPMDDVRAQVRQIVDGYFAGLATDTTKGAP
jgi:AcrR family transcriptional regulator